MNTPATNPGPGRSRLLVLAVVVLAAIATVAVAALLINIFERKQEAKNPFYRVVELNDTIDDPATWGKDFPLQYDLYLRTTDMERTKYGGSEGIPTRPRRPIRAPWWRDRSCRRILGSRPFGRDMPFLPIIASAADTPTCSKTRPSPSARSSPLRRCASTATLRW